MIFFIVHQMVFYSEKSVNPKNIWDSHSGFTQSTIGTRSPL